MTALYGDIYRNSGATVTQPPPEWRTETAFVEDRSVVPGPTDWAAPPAGRWRFALPVVALSVVLTLCAMPLTGWLIRSQLMVAFGAGLAASMKMSPMGTPQGNVAAAATRYPNDFPVQLGAAVMAPTPTNAQPGSDERSSLNVWNALRKLVPRFGGQPALYAILLDYLPANEIIVPTSPEEITAFNEQVKTSNKSVQVTNKVTLQECLDYSAAGEKADPDNMYFPLLRSHLLQAAGRPDDALKAILLAGTKKNYNDYYSVENDAKWAAIKAANGETGAISHTAVCASTLFISMARLRALSRFGIAHAITLEQKGNLQEGMALRLSLLHIGQTMETSGGTYIRNLVGAAIGGIAMSRPGGAPKLDIKSVQRPGESTETANQRLKVERQKQFNAYMERHGHPEAAQTAKELDAWRDEATKDFNAVMKQEPMGLSLRGFGAYIIWLGASLLALLSVLWTVLFGGMSFALARTGTVRRGERMPPAVGWGMALMFLPALLLTGLATLDNLGVTLVPLSLFLIALFLYLCSQLRTGVPLTGGYRKTLEPRRNLGIAALTVISVYVLGGLASLFVLGPLAFAQGVFSMFGFAFNATGSNANQSNPLQNILVTLLVGVISMAIPLSALINLAIISRVRRLPVSVGMVRGFRHVAIPMASILLLLYCGIAYNVAIQDARLQVLLSEQYQNERALFGKMAHLK
jgi:hypothetical protein